MEKQKARDTIQKYQELLKEGKYYEFAQKMTALGNRKNTSGKHVEAISLYIEGSKELIQYKELNEAYQLIQNVFDILKDKMTLSDEHLKSEFLSIYSLLPQDQHKLQFANRLLNEFYLGDQEICREVAIDLFNHELFHFAQKYIVNLNDAELSINFLQKWIGSVKCNDSEAEFFVARYVMAKISGHKLEEALKILDTFKKDTPLYNFLTFLLRACRIKSRKAYSRLISKYNDILKVDPSIQVILKRVASIYFGFDSEEQSSGIGGIFSSLLG